MSIDCLHFALHDNRANNVHTKLALLLLAEKADERGIALIEPHLFAAQACMTLETLRDCLKELLAKCLVERVKDDPRVVRQTQVAYRIMGYDA